MGLGGDLAFVETAVACLAEFDLQRPILRRTRPDDAEPLIRRVVVAAHRQNVHVPMADPRHLFHTTKKSNWQLQTFRATETSRRANLINELINYADQGRFFFGFRHRGKWACHHPICQLTFRSICSTQFTDGAGVAHDPHLPQSGRSTSECFMQMTLGRVGLTNIAGPTFAPATRLMSPRASQLCQRLWASNLVNMWPTLCKLTPQVLIKLN